MPNRHYTTDQRRHRTTGRLATATGAVIELLEQRCLLTALVDTSFLGDGLPTVTAGPGVKLPRNNLEAENILDPIFAVDPHSANRMFAVWTDPTPSGYSSTTVGAFSNKSGAANSWKNVTGLLAGNDPHAAFDERGDIFVVLDQPSGVPNGVNIVVEECTDVGDATAQKNFQG